MPKKPGSRWSRMTPLLAFSCFCLVVGDLLFGYDVGNFGGILGNPGFIRQFGSKNANGVYKLSSLHTSLLASLAFIGKFLGCLAAAPLIERFGHRVVFVQLSVVSIIGVIIEITSAGTGPETGRLAQLIVGRIVVYAAIGLVEICVSTYQSEIVHPGIRGFVVTTLQMFLNCGGLLASGLNRAFRFDTTSTGWRTVTGVQLIFPVLIVACVPFIPDSPRWLLSRDRNDDAITSLRRLRPAQEVQSGQCEEELASIKAGLTSNVHKNSWMSTLRGTNLRRTMLVVMFYTYGQITGQAFVSTYAVIFYQANGYAAHAFTYPIITSVFSILSCIPCMHFVDTAGRRVVLMTSYFLQALFLFLVAGMGSLPNKNGAEKNAVVAWVMLFGISYSLGGAGVPYLLGAELPNHSVREKTSTIGTSINVVWAFVVNFSMPYLLAAISVKVGWVFGSISVSALVLTFLFLPETKGMTLEEIDDVFARPFNPFRSSRVREDDESEIEQIETDREGNNSKGIESPQSVSQSIAPP